MGIFRNKYKLIFKEKTKFLIISLIKLIIKLKVLNLT